MSSNTKISDLVKFISSCEKHPTDLRLFLITEKQIIRIYKGMMNAHEFSHELGIVRFLEEPERGKILDLFSKLEFFVNELIRLKIVGLDYEKSLMLDDVLEKVDFFFKIKLLNEWGIIDNELLGLIMQTKQTRDNFAHAWDESEVFYKGKEIETNFSQFKRDMEKIWRSLIKIYSKEQEKIDIQSIVEKFKEINK